MVNCGCGRGISQEGGKTAACHYKKHNINLDLEAAFQYACCFLFVRKQQHPCAKIEVIVQIDQPGRDEFGFCQQMRPLLLLLIQHRRYNIFKKQSINLYTNNITMATAIYGIQIANREVKSSFLFLFHISTWKQFHVHVPQSNGPSIGRNDYHV